ncbi:hypothetical protein DMUE_2084, partial [Dictyocoela muelleri]
MFTNSGSYGFIMLKKGKFYCSVSSNKKDSSTALQNFRRQRRNAKRLDEKTYRRSEIFNNKDIKYREYHKSYTHSNEECRAKHPKNNKQPNNRSYAFKEPISTPKIIEFPIKINESIFTAMINTGSAENYIPEIIALRQNLQTHELKE